MNEQDTEKKVESQRQHEPVSFGIMGSTSATLFYRTCLEGIKFALESLVEGDLDASRADDVIEEFQNAIYILRQTYQV